MPYALSCTGGALGLGVMVLVAVANDYTTLLLIDAAHVTGRDSLEGLADWAGGPGWRVRARRLPGCLPACLLAWLPAAALSECTAC